MFKIREATNTTTQTPGDNQSQMIGYRSFLWPRNKNNTQPFSNFINCCFSWYLYRPVTQCKTSTLHSVYTSYLKIKRSYFLKPLKIQTFLLSRAFKETRDHRLPQNSDLAHPVDQPFLPVPYLWKDNSTFDRVGQVRNTATDVQQNLLVGELLNQ